MVRDGIYYALGLSAAAGVLAWLVSPAYAVPPLLLAGFFLWFFRDPERDVPQEPGIVVSPADGNVTDVGTVLVEGSLRPRVSIFLNVFDVHVNRAPIAGTVGRIEYRRGKFGNAMGAISAERNEQNIVTVDGEGQSVVFKQIAGLLARRIVFTPREGDPVARGQRVGMIKFGSRVDVIMDPGTAVAVKVGEHVKGGASVLGHAQPAPLSGLQPKHAEVNVSERVLTGDR